MFQYFKQRKERKRQAQALYEEAVVQARQSVFYELLGVPDTVDGRFELISLHCFLMMRRLQVAGEKKLSQKLFDVFFKNMELSLREMGVGDLSIPKHMKRMMQGFNGRADQYEKALAADDDKMLGEAIERNIYGTIEKPNKQYVSKIATYIKDSAEIESPEVFAVIEKEGDKKHA